MSGTDHENGSGPVSPREFLRADDMLRDCFVLARDIYDSGCRPDVLIALWRGGAPVGLVVHEYFAHKGHDPYHAVIKAQSYSAPGERGEVSLDRIDHVLENVSESSSVLVLDDIFDTGATMARITDEFSGRVRELLTAVLYYKPGASQVDLVPDYYVRKTDRWIVFPHEINGLTDAELRQKPGGLYDLL